MAEILISCGRILGEVARFVIYMVFWSTATLGALGTGAIFFAASPTWQGKVVGAILCTVGYVAFAHIAVKSYNE
ncbi:MAG: hypothetical protein A2312_01755 [Candidatus Staskawiczbacteria bacterium RIFOXYB2_FULL_32_9]|uniref:Uncharacterized protein n=1 Tax=Candidatus Staskawiczbacteria bacterium RIFOXYD1_FULL_32_13 TaxID=1802234 RepID=A0A1G2JL22_9BACT|nr:MAG: hypothetical protein A2360_03130 [Candidatus Staskawiczbacteria bacterium RIFOXYB1_FULL_32_11]OGZ82984.1 MAG: hypothetical protein A2312_01755 [Candidatus Staskawiczbacteria bacterium RIFOXYB2_FULL_32_9]OGZ87814.1 MAG: hypothetical protein A2561_04400 [Candidatus Staskawiczbacteria bacterium RIFOXYD1_FULL_32_13]